ncbi:hypothetical protein [Streptomyces sp. 8L]|uniref:hypothetical protein n=1 Tax=Streptomyces sp. 8L TaxID=2877242 RepID=UPI001CD60A56|nr:hypothetical protein [Streptomyces sp. 8L]MCA1218668.1 hypothetical protein [Streptomyces sp. 8L]
MTLLDSTLAEHIMAAPIGQLLAEHNAFIHPSDVTDEGYLGIGVQRADGWTVLAIPTRVTGEMRDSIARILLAQVLGVDISLPDCIEIHRSASGGHR